MQKFHGGTSKIKGSSVNRSHRFFHGERKSVCGQGEAVNDTGGLTGQYCDKANTLNYEQTADPRATLYRLSCTACDGASSNVRQSILFKTEES